MKARLFVALALVFALLVSSATWADYTAWQTFQWPVDYPEEPAVTNWSRTWTVDQFNPSLGTLLGVEILWDGAAAG